MATDTSPSKTNTPLELSRYDDQPAITIYDFSGSDQPPIKIVKVGSDEADSKCCSGSIGSGGGSGPGGGKTPPPKPRTPPDLGGVDPVTDAPDGSGEVPYRQFTGTLQIRIHVSDDDPYGWEGQEPFFVSDLECKPYRPPTIPAPSTAFGFPSLTQKLDEFLANPTLSPYFLYYEVVSDTVSPPGAECTP